MSQSYVHVSSAIISVLPAFREDVVRLVSEMPSVEVFHQSKSKIVIVMEAPEGGTIGARLATIASLDGVLSANMVFEQVASAADLGE